MNVILSINEPKMILFQFSKIKSDILFKNLSMIHEQKEKPIPAWLGTEAVISDRTFIDEIAQFPQDHDIGDL